jgi:hypothetical protein
MILELARLLAAWLQGQGPLRALLKCWLDDEHPLLGNVDAPIPYTLKEVAHE